MKTSIKRLFAIILALTVIFTLVGCSDKPGSSGESTEKQAPSESNAPGQTDAQTEQPTVSGTVETSAMTFQEVVDQTVVHVLNKTTVPYNEGYISAVHGIDYEDYDVATVLTVGIERPANVNFENEVSDTRVVGETTLDPNGKPAVYSIHGGFYNEDKTYEIIVYSIGGDVDPSKAEMQFTTYDGSVFTKKFVNDGAAEGFEEVQPKFKSDYNMAQFGTESRIVKLKGRYYACWNKRKSDYEYGTLDGKEYEAIYEAITVIPLEGGFGQAIILEDCQVNMPTDIANTHGEFSMDNLEGITDGIMDEGEVSTKFVLKVVRVITEEKVDGEYSSEVKNSLYRDRREFLKQSSVTIADGDGGTVTFTYGSKFY